MKVNDTGYNNTLGDEQWGWMRIIRKGFLDDVNIWAEQRRTGDQTSDVHESPTKAFLSPPSLEPIKSCGMDESASWMDRHHPWVGIQSCFNKGTVIKGREWIKDNQRSVHHHRLDDSWKLLCVGLPGVRREPLLGLGKREDCCGLQNRALTTAKQ